MKKTVSEGRSAPGYSYQANGTKVPDEQIQERLMELISLGDGFAWRIPEAGPLAGAENTSYRSIRRKCIAYVRSWTSCAHNDRNLLCIHENRLVTERLLTPTSSSKQTLNTDL
ncbi:hypothetical protein P7H06_20795 [Paenibacillus larvae]|nr:hypothetical protein [Paenibacillus larvae]MDT2261445.1 hypothetical protein [Paenibacillus larvae]